MRRTTRELGAELRTYCNRGEILEKIGQILEYNRGTIAAWFLEPKTYSELEFATLQNGSEIA